MKIIVISGGSASGKTTLAKNLNEKLPNSFLLSQDHYTKDVSHLNDKDLMNYNFDVPESVHGDILIQNIEELLKYGKTKIPHYDFVTSSCKLFHEEIKKPDILIIEGIFSLHFEKIQTISHFKIFVDADEKTRFSRRLNRDLIERGDTEEEIKHRFYTYVKPGHDKYIEPQKSKCDLIVDSNDMNKEFNNILNLIKNLNIKEFSYELELY